MAKSMQTVEANYYYFSCGTLVKEAISMVLLADNATLPKESHQKATKLILAKGLKNYKLEIAHQDKIIYLGITGSFKQELEDYEVESDTLEEGDPALERRKDTIFALLVDLLRESYCSDSMFDLNSELGETFWQLDPDQEHPLLTHALREVVEASIEALHTVGSKLLTTEYPSLDKSIEDALSSDYPTPLLWAVLDLAQKTFPSLSDSTPFYLVESCATLAEEIARRQGITKKEALSNIYTQGVLDALFQ